MLDLKKLVGLSADGLADAVTVLGSPLKGSKDQEIQCALQDIEFSGSGPNVVEILPPKVVGCLPPDPNASEFDYGPAILFEVERITGTAVVTGGARGIGRAVAAEMARVYSQVAILDVCSRDDADPALREIQDAGAEALWFEADVAKRARVEEVFRVLDREAPRWRCW